MWKHSYKTENCEVQMEYNEYWDLRKKIQIIVLTKCQHPFSKRFLARAKTKTNFRRKKKRDTLPFWTLSCKILIKCTSVELRLFFYFKENGILRVKSVLKYVTFNPIQCSSFLRQGMITRTGTSDELSRFIEDSNWRTSLKYLSLKSFSMPRERSRFG